jgi:hypothetical protein
MMMLAWDDLELSRDPKFLEKSTLIEDEHEWEKCAKEYLRVVHVFFALAIGGTPDDLPLAAEYMSPMKENLIVELRTMMMTTTMKKVRVLPTTATIAFLFCKGWAMGVKNAIFFFWRFPHFGLLPVTALALLSATDVPFVLKAPGKTMQRYELHLPVNLSLFRFPGMTTQQYQLIFLRVTLCLLRFPRPCIVTPTCTTLVTS